MLQIRKKVPCESDQYWCPVNQTSTRSTSFKLYQQVQTIHFKVYTFIALNFYHLTTGHITFNLEHFPSFQFIQKIIFIIFLLSIMRHRNFNQLFRIHTFCPIVHQSCNLSGNSKMLLFLLIT